MTAERHAQTPGTQERINSLDREFARLHLNSCALVASTPAEVLYFAIDSSTTSLTGLSPAPGSVGECVLRSAATVEQTFGGITANLWDDPFEWTLPEYLSSPSAILTYLAEVEAMRQRAFSSFVDDANLAKQVMLPSGEPAPLSSLLRETLRRADTLQAHALVLLKSLSGIRPSGFII
jgi:hypothetical protein